MPLDDEGVLALLLDYPGADEVADEDGCVPDLTNLVLLFGHLQLQLFKASKLCLNLAFFGHHRLLVLLDLLLRAAALRLSLEQVDADSIADCETKRPIK